MTTELATRPLNTLRLAFTKPSMAGWLQKQIHGTLNRNAQQMINIVLHAAAADERLAQCTPTSILANLGLAAQIGLVPNTALGHAWLIAFNNSKPPANGARGPWIKVMEAQLVIGYKGYIKLVHDAAGMVVQAQPVYHGDLFDYDLASFPPVKYHRPGQGERVPAALQHAWCHIKTNGGQVFGDVLTKQQIYKHRDCSKGYLGRDGKPRPDSPWLIHEPEMWKKTAVRHTLKMVPTGNDERLERALSADDNTRDNPGDIIDMSDAPAELGEFDQASIAAQGEGESAGVDLSDWVPLLAECTDVRSLDDVSAKAHKKLPKEATPAFERLYLQHLARIRGGA